MRNAQIGLFPRLRWRCWKLLPRWRRPDQQQPLALKLTLLITSLVITAVGGTTLLSIQREQASFRKELQYQADLLLDTLDTTLRDALYQLDADLLSDFIATLSSHQDLLTSGYIYDAQGRLLADTSPQGAGYALAIDPLGQQLVTSSTTLFEWQDEELLAGRAVVVGRQSIGAIRLGLSTERLQQEITTVRNRGIKIAIFAAIVSTFLAQWISYTITKPIQALVQGTERIAQGDFSQAINLETDDEISTLADAFNDMGRQLQQTLALLEQQNENLESRVQQRTEELTQTLRELQEMQTQLVQSEKMSSLGQLVAGIAHEVNNPVNFIHGNLQHLDAYTQDLLDLNRLYERCYPDPCPEIRRKVDEIDLPFLTADLTKILKSITIGTKRIREIVLSLRNFSRLDEAELKAVNLHDGLDSTLLILQHRLKANAERPEIKVCKDYGDLPPVPCYAGQLNQVFMNLLANAIDALEDNNAGSSYQELESNPNIIWIRTRVSDNDRVMVTIQDNGPGIPESVQAKLFDPFFTTKPIGKGTGLGLSISYRIIETHGGSLYIDRTVDQGTAFTVELPVNN